MFKQTKAKLLFALVLLPLVLLSTETYAASVLPSQASESIVVGQPVTPRKYSGGLRQLPKVTPSAEAEQSPALAPTFRPKKYSGANFNFSSSAFQFPQFQMSASSMPSSSASFKGLGFPGSSGWPPDPVGDVSSSYYMQAVNDSVGIYSKTGTAVITATFGIIWNNRGTGTPCDAPIYHHGQPLVLYDQLADRWILADSAWIDFINGPYYECIAVTQSSDLVMGPWAFYGVRLDDAAHPYLADYPKIGLWPDGIYLSANMFDILPDETADYKGVRVWAFNRTELETGAVLNPQYVDLDPTYFSLLPSNLRGNQPPSGRPNYFVSNDLNAFQLDIWEFDVDWATPTNSSFTGPYTVTTNAYTLPPETVPELGGEDLDSLGDRLMMQNQYRNIGGVESLWLAHTAGSNGVTGIGWYQLDVTGGLIDSTPVQSGIYQPDGDYRWLPSLAVDKDGNMAVGYSASSSSMYPAIRYAGRLASDPLNTLAQGETTLIAGTGAQSGGFGLWGSYSAMSVDPSDDCTFWYTNEYYETTGSNWQTRIGSFKFDSCGSTPPTSTKTNTPIPATDTPTKTNTPIPPTDTPTKTNTPVATVTPTLTDTPTPTSTSLPSTADQIVFVRPQPLGDGNSNNDIWIMNADGSNETQLTTFSDADRWPALSPDGSKVAYVSYRSEIWTLWVMNSDGTNPVQLPYAGNVQAPTWSADGNKIAFAGDAEDGNEIWTINADGSNPQRLTTSSAEAKNPAWSPDGSKLVYSYEPTNDYFDLYTVNSDGTGQTLLISATATGFSNETPSWSPDGTQIATIHSSAGNQGPYDLWLMNADGSNGQALVQNISNPNINNLAWSQDGNWLVFANSGHIWTVQPDGSHLFQPANPGGWEPDTNVSGFSDPTPTPTLTPIPDTEKIVFVRPAPESGADSNVWIMNPDGSNETQLTTWNADDMTPVISPDGSQVAYYSYRNNSWTLWVMNSDGTNPIQLLVAGNIGGAPAWSPDGSQIAYGSDSQDWWEIWVVNADGTNSHRVTTHGPAAGHPSWSADGQKLTYGVEPTAKYLDLYTVNSDGTGQTLLVSASGSGSSNHQPAWSPDGTQIATIHWPAGSWTGPYDLWLMDANGSNGHTLVQNIDSGTVNNLAWSQDSNWVLFAKGSQLWRIRRDGTGLTQITTTSGWQPDTNAETFSNPTPTPTPTPTASRTPTPTSLPGGSAIVFVWPQPAFNPTDTDTNIWIMNPDGSNPTQLTTLTNTERLPAISPDGSKIVYQTFITNRCTMWVMNRDGTNPTQLQVNSTSSDCGSPTWSPDGSQIAFGSNANSFWEIWVMNADGTNPHQLSNHPGAAGNPSWSPTGQKLVYLTEPSAKYIDLYTINSDGTGQTLLVSASGTGFSNHQPAWSPDGTQIATIHWTAGSSVGPYDLWLMNADGSNGHVLVSNVDYFDSTNLSWSADSNWVVFSKGGQVWRVKRDGTGLTQITTTGGWEPHTNADTFSAALNTNLMAYWQLEEAASLRVDATGHGNNLSDNNGVGQLAGKIGNAAQFTPANSTYLSVADTPDLSVGDIDFTLSAWVYLTDKDDGYQVILGKGTSATFAGQEYELFYTYNVGATDRFGFFVQNGVDQGLVYANQFGAPTLNTWYWIVAWHDAGTNTVNLQVNNGAVDSAPWSGGSQDTAQEFTLGKIATDPGFYWNGRIDEVGFWKRTLTTAERTALYNCGFGLTYPFTASLSPCPTATSTPTRTNTPVPPTNTPTRTNTPPNTVPPTNTSTPTLTPIPDTEKIVFVRPQPEIGGDSNIWIMNADGSNENQLTTWIGDDLWPAISPDGSKIAYVSIRNNQQTLWVMNSDGTNATQLPVSGNTQRLDWSPDGSKIAFTNDSQDWWEIWTINADGTNPQRLTTTGPAAGEPAWSPDGQKIIYGVNPSAGYKDLYIMNSNGTGQTLLVSASGTGLSTAMAAWSLDGTQIAVVRWSAGGAGPYTLWLMNPDGSNGYLILSNIEDPAFNRLAWSSDGNWLVFSKGGQVWRVQQDGNNPIQITSSGGWEPDTNADTFSAPRPTATFTPTPTRTHTNTPTPTRTPTRTNTPVPTCSAPPSGMVSWWPGEGNANDRMGTNHGTLQNGVTFATGRVNQAFQFDGTASYVRVLDDVSLRPVNAMTVDAWIKPEAPLYIYAPIFKKSGVGQSNGYALEFNGSNVNFWIYTNGGWKSSPSLPVPLGAWSHVAGVYDGVTVGLYVNGNLVGSPTSAPGGMLVSTEELNIGRDPSNPTTRFYHGLIDEVEFFNRALSASEIQAIYTAGSAGHCVSTPTPTPPPASKIVFVRPQPGTGSDSNIWIMNADGSNQTQLTTWNGEDLWPALSLDGSKITYVSIRNNQQTLWVMNNDGSNPTQLPYNGNIQSPSWSLDGSQITFQGDSVDWWEVWTINADGSNSQRLTTHAGASGAPDWSPNGQKIIYINEPSAMVHDLYTVNNNGTGQSLLVSASGTGFSNHRPAWSPDGTQIATIHYPAGSFGPYNLWLMNADGSNGQVLVQGIDSPNVNHLSWSADGNWLLFSKSGQVWRVQKNGSNPIQLTSSGGWAPDTNADTFSDPTPTPTLTPTRTNTPLPPSPTWTPLPPGSKRIVFTRPKPQGDGSVNSDIWIMNADGSNQIQLTTFTGEDRQPAISPDGLKITYISRRNNLNTLWVMNSNGTNPTQLPMDGNNGAPAWSSDGSQIAFSNDTVDWWEIWVINANGTNPHRLTTNTWAAGEPSWSPNGQKLVYAVNPQAAGYEDIYTVNSNGTGQTLLVSNTSGFSNHFPEWSPDGTQIATIHWPAGSSGPYDLWLMNANGSNGQVLVQNIDHPHGNNVSWSAEGNWLLFSKNGQVWRVQRNGTGLTQITTTGGWEPHTNANFSPIFQAYLPMVANNHCGPIYSDDFSNSASGWLIGDSGDALWQYFLGEYRLLVRSTEWSAAVRPGVKFSNYVAAVDVRNATGTYGTYGLIFGLADNWSQFYSFEVDPEGTYLIWRYQSSGWTLLSWGNSSAIQEGTATNRLKLERNGASIKAYANDQLLTTVWDGSFIGSRYLGLNVTAYDQPNVDIRFDNFKVYPLACGSITGLSSETSQMLSSPSVTINEVGNRNHASAQVGDKARNLPNVNAQPGAVPTQVDR